MNSVMSDSTHVLTWLSNHQQSVWHCQFVRPAWNSQPWYTRSRIKKFYTQMRQAPRSLSLQNNRLVCVSINKGTLILFLIDMTETQELLANRVFVYFLKCLQILQ